jgi:hypothetical protein
MCALHAVEILAILLIRAVVLGSVKVRVFDVVPVMNRRQKLLDRCIRGMAPKAAALPLEE